MKRHWFRADDGTFYRNCNLIAGEIRATRRWLWNVGRLNRLERERDEARRVGPTRKLTLGRGDVEVKPVPNREAYPNHPGLWGLDGSG